MVAYSDKVATEICERIALGETVSDICKDKHMPSERTVWKWRQIHFEFETAYSIAREDQMHAWANQIIHLADDTEGDFKVTVPIDSPDLERIETKRSVTFKFNSRHVNRANLMINTRKWLMERYAPKAFGDGVGVSVDVSVAHKSDEELIADMRGAFEKCGLTAEELLEMLGVSLDAVCAMREK